MKLGRHTDTRGPLSSIVLLVGLVVAAFTALPAHAQLGADCTASLLGRTAQVNDEGTFFISNIPVEPGLHRVRITCSPDGGVVARGQSALFDIQPNVLIQVGPIAFGAVDPIPVFLQGQRSGRLELRRGFDRHHRRSTNDHPLCRRHLHGGRSMRVLRTLGFLVLMATFAPVLRAQGGGLLADFLSEGSTTDLGSVLSSLGGEVQFLRLDLDINGDGVPEIFLARRDSWTRFSGFKWRAYEVGDGGEFRYLGSLDFNEQSIRVVEPFVLNVMQVPGNGKFWSIRYRLTETGFEGTELSEGTEADPEIADEERAEARFWREKKPVRAWAVVTDRGLGPWRESVSSRIVTGLRPIVGEEYKDESKLRALAQRRATLIGQLEELRPCPPNWCEVYLDLADLNGDGEPEILLNTSRYPGSSHLVYTRKKGGWRFLGELPSGSTRIEPKGRVSVLDFEGSRVLYFTVGSETISGTGEVSAVGDSEAWERERRGILHSPNGGDPFERYRVDWAAANASPESPAWLTFKTREPADIDVDLSLPVLNPKSGDDS